jgi:hypothetical protein
MGHSGICRRVDRFTYQWLEQMARDAESRLGDDFEPFGATLQVHPIRISHVASVGEGVALHLSPHDLKAWEWWGVFEADVEISRRRRFAKTWEDLMSREVVRTWIDANSAEYLRLLNAGRESYPGSLSAGR